MLKQNWSDLTPRQQARYGNGCGAGGTLLNKIVLELLFNADCRQHDFYYRRGGDFFDKMEADVMFYGHMLKSINNQRNHFITKIPMFVMATLYFSAVSVFGLLFFSWGIYKRFKKTNKKCRCKLTLKKKHD